LASREATSRLRSTPDIDSGSGRFRKDSLPMGCGGMTPAAQAEHCPTTFFTGGGRGTSDAPRSGASEA